MELEDIMEVSEGVRRQTKQGEAVGEAAGVIVEEEDGSWGKA